MSSMRALSSPLASRALAALLLLTSCAGRVLVTPHAVQAAPRPPPAHAPPADEPCDALSARGAGDLPDLAPCSCYPHLPSACTRLLRQRGVAVGSVVPTQAPPARGADTVRVSEDCGALVGSTVVPPDSCQGGYYGHDASLDPAYVLEYGLPARGDDWDLLRHAEQMGSNSAFRGTTKLVTYPDGGGAAAWADEGGHVYEVTCVPSWDVNRALQGRRLVSEFAVGRARFGGNLALGEHEHAIPARVPPEHIKRYGAVVASAAGVPFVPRSSWVDNPNWEPCFCKHSLSECDDALPCH